MNNNNLFIPINNQYKKIDLLSLKLNNYKTPTLKERVQIFHQFQKYQNIINNYKKIIIKKKK